MTESTIGTGQDLEAIRAVAQLRPIRNAHPGWWVRHFDDGRESFDEVRVVKNWVHKTDPAQNAVELLLVDHADPERGIQVFELTHETVLCVKSAEAKKLGLAVDQ